MGLILTLIIGGFLGWIASIIMRTDGQQGIFMNIVVGIVGAIIGGVLFGRFFGGASITTGAADIRSLLVSLLGAIILLGLVNLLRRGAIR